MRQGCIHSSPFFLWIALFGTTAGVLAGGTAVSRFSSAVYTPGGAPITVTIDVVPDAGTQAYALEDMPPSGWTVSAVSNNGVYDATNRKVKWGLFFDANTRSFSYSVTPPANASGVQTFSGAASFGSTDVPITGARTLSPASSSTTTITTTTTTGSTTSTTLPAGPYTLDFAQVAAGGGWRSFLILNNLAARTVSLQVDFRGAGGQPLVLTIDGVSQSGTSVTIPVNGFRKLSVDAPTQAGTLSGWCQVHADGAVGGLLVYQSLDRQTVISQATVLPSLRLRNFRMALPLLGQATEAALAIANPGSQTAQITLRYFNPSGQVGGSSVLLSIPPGGQMARFMGEIFPSLAIPQEGVVEVSSTAGLVPVGLLFINNYQLFTTVPVTASDSN